MIRFDAWHLPDGEAHLPDWMTRAADRVDGRLRYQGRKYDAALAACRHRRVAVDVGAHVGLWSYWLARDFGEVHAFEPMPAHLACFAANVHARPGVHLHACALGDRPGRVVLESGPASSGDTRITAIRPGGAGVEMRTLDSFGLPLVDFLKVDCEGFEVFVLEGAIETLRRCRPTVIVEQKPGHAQRFGRDERAGVAFLEALGAQLRWQQAGDFVLTFPEVA